MKKAINILVLSALMLILNSVAAMAQDDVTCQFDVIVQRDDWLSKLAEKFYSDVLAYQPIADATNAKAAVDPSYARIDDVDFIETGWKLCIPGIEQVQGSLDQSDSVASANPTVLKVWDIWTRDVESQVIETLNQEFEAANPGVTVERTAKSFDDMKATVQLALSDADGPDVVQVYQGRSDMVALVAAGLLTDLTPYWQKYGWSQRLPVPLAARNRVVSDGSAYGRGNLYGMAPTVEFVGIFYNKDKFATASLEVPKTFAEFEAALAQLKAAGETPIMFGNLDGWPAIHTYGEIENVYLKDRSYMDNFIYGRGDVSFDIPENREAASTYKEWANKGYFTPDFNGATYQDAFDRFSNGEGAMFLTGTWASSDLLAGPNGDNMGFFLLPPQTEGSRKPVVAGTSSAYAIRQDSANTDLAAAYIDWMMSDRAMELWQQAGLTPVAPVAPASVEAGTLYADMLNAWDQIVKTQNFGHYLDWATPTFYDTIIMALQDLGDGRLTPTRFVQKLQAGYAAFQAE
ncbi:MAG: extracellular solute-binding protein [Chloroflexi bacterium]|nr:extracellular solute-binding protein [Chloroflexota bacterium]